MALTRRLIARDTSNVGIGIGGFHGVLLFFVISGFLITGILLEARGSAPAAVVLHPNSRLKKHGASFPWLVFSAFAQSQ